MEQIKLIAMDMDGTLLDDTHQIPPQNLSALRKAQAMGVQIAICSGRTASDVSYYAADAGLHDCHILALNGTCCLTEPHAEPYLLRTVLPNTAACTVEVLLSHNVTFASFQQNRVIVVHGDNAVDKRNWGTHVARANRNAYLYGREALEAHIGEGVCKFVYIDQDHAPRIEQVREALLPIGGLYVTRSWTNNLELMPAGVNKGTSLRALAEALDIPRAQVMAIGDYDNDLDMIEYAGLGVAMSNGSERVRNAAQYITLSNAEFGVAEAIRRFVLEVAI
jgi:hypothetical protein